MAESPNHPPAAWLRVLAMALSPFPMADVIVGRIVGSAIVALLVGVLIAIWHWGAVVPIALLFAGLLWWCGVRLQRQLDATTTARVVFGDPPAPHLEEHIAFGVRSDIHDAATGQFIQIQQRVEKKLFKPLRLPISNDPPGHLPAANVLGAWATITFIHDGRQVEQLKGMWTGSKQLYFDAPPDRPTPPPSADTGRRDLMADGSVHWLDIAFFPEDGNGDLVTWRDDGVVVSLPASAYEVVVVVAGQGLPRQECRLFLEPDGDAWRLRKAS
jgi:hypothetical protein